LIVRTIVIRMDVGKRRDSVCLAKELFMDVVKSLLRLAVVLAVLAGLEARAQNDVPARKPGTQQKESGTVSFPVSCGAAAQ
jgi:hypothetical protein